MWSQLVLCLLVGYAYASTYPAWRDNTEYVYLVNGRTLSSLHEATDQYSGIFLKAKFYVYPRADGKLQGRIADAQYAQIHTYLPNGWMSEVPEAQMSYKTLPFSPKPFQMLVEDGMIRKLIVEKDLTNWEANIIKSIVSQFQLDVEGKSAIYSPINTFPSKERFDGVFRTMEETVTGKTETLYEIHRLPEYLVQDKPWKFYPELKEDEQIIEVVKSKNYSYAEERPSYHYGFQFIDELEPSSNKMGDFFIRESYSRAILTGQLSKFDIQKAYTVNKIYVNPTFNNKEMGSVISMVNVTLIKRNAQAPQPEEITNPVEIGNLVYTYENPSADNTVHKKHYDFEGVEDNSEESHERSWQRQRRSVDQIISKQYRNIKSEEKHQYQPRPQMNRAPESPLLPYLVGYHGKSIKENRDFDIKQNVEKLIKEISEEMQEPEEILRKSTLNKYTILTTFVRLMNEEEIKFVAEQVYTQNREGQQYLSWVVYHNAVAEAGTGPAFLNIKQWIESKKIQGQDAADVIATMAHSVRVPTEEYMRKYFELIKEPYVIQQKYLNETAFLSYSELVYKVYINRNESHNQFPVHSFGTFYTKEGRDYVKSTVIPYFTQQLHDAISRADARQIHVYIRVLGNIGHQRILEAFEPYLEGHKQASQFQRMLMVLALDKLVEYNPVIARSVLYKIYQNIAEVPEVRVVTVYLLMRTEPPVEMLQRMAESTNIESQEAVVAAIKSAIETASRLESPKHQYLQEAAKAAKPLLTRKYYGGDYSFIDLRDFIVENMKVDYTHKFVEIGSEDSNWPKLVKLAVGGDVNGMYDNYFSVSGMVSSVEELTHVFYRQTEEYQRFKSERSQQFSGESKWSSATVANLLNYQTEEREQLEGLIYTEMENIHRLFSFDNQTIERFPEVLRQQEEILRNGKIFNYARLRQFKEMALSFPTEMGLPFMYTYDNPLLVRFEGKIQAISTPQISKDGKLYKPDKLSAKMDMYFTFSTRAQSHLSFVTPFDHQVYLAGYDQNLQAHIPLYINVDVDFKTKQMEIEYEVKKIEKDARLLHYSSYPYTSRSDLFSVSPVALRPNTHVIKPEMNQHRQFDVTFGKKEVGMAFRAWGHHPVQSLNLYELVQMIKTDGLTTMWQQFWDKNVLQHTEANIAFIPSQSPIKKITVRLGGETQYKKQPEIQTEEDFLTYSKFNSKTQSEDFKTLQHEMLKHVGSGIKSADLKFYDVAFEFEADKKYQHYFGFAMAKSNAGPKSRSVFYYKKNDEKPQQFVYQIKGFVPNTNALDLTYSLHNEPQAKYEFRFIYGPSEQQESMISGKLDFARSEARKQYLIEEEPMYHICKKEMQEGNFQLPACQNLTIQANFLDDIKINIEYKNLKRQYIDTFEGLFKGLRVFYYPMTEIKTIQPENENKISLRIQFQPESFKQVNFTVKAYDEETRLFNLSIHDHIVRSLVVPHPVFHLRSRIIGAIKGWKNFRPTCVIDQTAAQTFSNKTYPISLEKEWTVVMQYIPAEARFEEQQHQTVEEQLRHHFENYVVMVRQISEKQKEILITFNHPQTKGKTVEIYMKPKQQAQYSATNPAASVLVDNQEIQFNDQEIYDLYNGFVQVYALPNGEVKFEIRDAFYLIFDGQRVKVTAHYSKLRDSIFGLCGSFSHDQYEDFTTPANCVVRDPIQFVQSYFVKSSQNPRHQRSREFRHCVPKVIPLYANVISDFDAGRNENFQRDEEMASGTRLRHQYVEENGEICFTIRPIPTCNSYSRNTVSKHIPVHCIQSSKTAYYLKNQIDQGGNPDFSQKSETKKIRMDVPLECN